MGVIFFLSAQPVLPGPKIFIGDFIFKKCAHMGVFGVLYLCWGIYFRELEKKLGRKVKNKWWWCLVLTVIYAMLDEYHQSFVPGRTATVRDVGFDTLGATVAMLWSYRLL